MNPADWNRRRRHKLVASGRCGYCSAKRGRCKWLCDGCAKTHRERQASIEYKLKHPRQAKARPPKPQPPEAPAPIPALAMFEAAITEGVKQGTRTDLEHRDNCPKSGRGKPLPAPPALEALRLEASKPKPPPPDRAAPLERQWREFLRRRGALG